MTDRFDERLNQVLPRLLSPDVLDNRGAGGEIGFITQMIYESVKYPFQCFWFTTLVSKKDNLKTIYRTLNKVGAVTIKTIEMAQGQKRSRFVAWTFLSALQQKEWDFSNE